MWLGSKNEYFSYIIDYIELHGWDQNIGTRTTTSNPKQKIKLATIE